MSREGNKRYRVKQKVAGRCAICIRPAVGRVLCPYHLKKVREKNVKWRAERRFLGLCNRCDEPVVAGRGQCRYHLDLAAKKRKEEK